VLYLVEQPPYCDLLRLSLRLEGSSALAGQLSKFFSKWGERLSTKVGGASASPPFTTCVFFKHKSSAEQAALCTRPAEADVQGLPPKWWDFPLHIETFAGRDNGRDHPSHYGRSPFKFADICWVFYKDSHNGNSHSEYLLWELPL
jgi:hypothetical protein